MPVFEPGSRSVSSPSEQGARRAPGPLLPVRVLPPQPLSLGHPPTRPHRMRISRRLVLAGVLFTAALIATGIFLALSLAHRTPAWWAPVERADPEALQTARTLENGLATLLTKVRSGSAEAGAPPAPHPSSRTPRAEPAPTDQDIWTVALKASDANAWLATRLRVWLENDSDAPFTWPRAVTGLQVRFEGGVISVGASIARESADTPEADGAEARSQVLAASLVPEFRTDGSFWLPARWVSVGRLSLPAAWMLSAATPGAGSAGELPSDVANLPQTRDLLAAFAGTIPVMRTPIVKIGDGRRVRLVSLDARDGRLLITCQTLSREGTRAGK